MYFLLLFFVVIVVVVIVLSSVSSVVRCWLCRRRYISMKKNVIRLQSGTSLISSDINIVSVETRQYVLYLVLVVPRYII